MKRNNLLRTIVCTVGIVGIMSTAHAQYTANNQTNTISGVTSNWVGTYSVGNLSRDGLIVTNGGVLNSTFGVLGNAVGSINNLAVITGAGSAWNNVGTLTIGNSGGTNTLSIANGAKVANYNGNIGAGVGAGNFNNVLVNGAGSVWTNAGDLYAGGGIANKLDITGGGVVFAGNSYIGYGGGAGGLLTRSNNVFVTGTGSAMRNSGNLYVGYHGLTNALVVSSGGNVQNVNGFVGTFGSNTMVRVTGAGSTWNNSGFLDVGLGDGSFNSIVVSNGGAVTVSGATTIGSATRSRDNTLIVGGSGASFTGSGDVNVGQNGFKNSVVINSGGTVSAPKVYVGLNASATNNSVTLSGGNLTAASGGLEVRRGTVTMGSGSTMTVDQLSVANGAASVFAFNGGTLNTAATTVNNGSVFNVGDGVSLAVFNMQGGSHSFANGLLVKANGSLVGNGTVVGNVTSAGKIGPGNSPGTITINGSLTLQSTSILDIQIGGTTQGTDYDVIFVNGAVTLGGSLNISFLNSYQTNYFNDQGFIVLQGNSPLGGTFANLVANRVTTVGGEGSFYVDYVDNSVRLSGYQITIPEPSTCVLGLIGLAALFATRRARKS